MKFPKHSRSFRNTEITDVTASCRLTVRYRFFAGSDPRADATDDSDIYNIMVTLLEDGAPSDEVLLFDVGRDVCRAKALYDTLIRNLSLPETALDDFDTWCALETMT